MTPIGCCGFECGVGVTGNHITTSGTSSINTNLSFVRQGLRSGRCNPTAGQGNISFSSPSSNKSIHRVYVYFSSLPTGNATIVSFNVTGDPGAYFKASDSKIYPAFGISGTPTFGATGIAVTTGQWYLLDVRIDASANPWTIDVQVDGVACNQLTNAVAAETQSGNTIGINRVNNTADMYFDDWVVSQTVADYPIGAGKVLSFVPAADGTHTFTSTHAILGTTGAPTTGSNITSATTNAFSFVNARPIGGGAADATRLWNQATLLSTEYAEVTIEQTTEVNPPRAVEVIVIAREASSTTCNSTFKVNDNGTENTVYAMTVPVGNSDEFRVKQYATMPADSAAWTLARFKGLRLRWGYSSDATPDVYCRGWMVEAEFPESLDASAVGRPEGQIGQGQMQQLLSQ